MHSVRYKYSPESFQSTWQLNENRNVEYVFRNAMDYNLPVPRTEFFKKQPMYSIASRASPLYGTLLMT